jgi:ribosome-interacting GTPase 1
VLEYGGAEIQILDLPGIIEGASEGKGRGRQVISAAKVCLGCEAGSGIQILISALIDK